MSEQQNTIMAIAAVTMASVVGMGTALIYSNKRIQAQEEAEKQKIRAERRKYRDRYRQTAEYRRRKEMIKEKRKQRDAQMQEVAYFNENDEMVLTKVKNDAAEDLPAGYVKVNRDDPAQAPGHYKVSKNMTGEAFINNLETINKKRVESGVSTPTPATSKNEKAQVKAELQAQRNNKQEVDDETMINLDPKKMRKGDNIFLDFMALYSRASVKD